MIIFYKTIACFWKWKRYEYKRVFILNRARVYTEYGRNIDQRKQEANLSYIALTRSKDTIFLVASNRSKQDEKELFDDDFDSDSIKIYNDGLVFSIGRR